MPNIWHLICICSPSAFQTGAKDQLLHVHRVPPRHQDMVQRLCWNARTWIIVISILDSEVSFFSVQSISLPDLNYGSSCYLFTECLQEIATWTSSNPKHFPIVVFIHHGGTTTPQSYLGSEYSAALAQLQVRGTQARR